MIALTEEQPADFQECLQWQTGMRLPDGRVLGVPGKRGKINPGTDLRVETVAPAAAARREADSGDRML